MQLAKEFTPPDFLNFDIYTNTKEKINIKLLNDFQRFITP